MKDLIHLLNNSNMAQLNEDVTASMIKNRPIDQETAKAKKELLRLADNHISDRLTQLEVIGKMLVLVGEDETNGIVEQADLSQIGYFIQDEMQALSAVDELKQNAAQALQIGGGGV